ncbi:DUF2513 domain-containing protein [Paenibacillus segetis]|uniref:DUF2513 domain-containing protein n=1 Tax=Paenibacillus segetis TaxID=1325360 RepID=A0ABQ1YAH4_9BACL|nr:DUF2513 domain-containing protein [Paenibacillus segetis]GGH17417.1 hypothetical protein GCM10008013_12740 [Paenibacillus segetis]
MKLNHDCFREMLLTIESELKVDACVLLTELHKHDDLEKYEYDEVLYCSIKLREAGFIETVGTDLVGVVGRIPKIRGLTYAGHLFLDNIRDNSRWNKVKQKAISSGMVALNILASLAESYAKKAIGLE